MPSLRRLSVSLIVTLAVAAAANAAGQSTGVAFDQLDKIAFAGTTISLDSFAKDRADILAASSSSQYPASGDDPLQQTMQATGLGALMKGSVLRYSYLGDWSRIDDPVKNTATITRPDLHQVIYLDLANKTYRIADAATVAETDPASQFAKMFGSMGGAMPKGPGSAVMTLKGSHASLPSRQYEGLALSGMTTTVSTVITKNTGSCPALDSTLTVVTYTAPTLSAPKALQAGAKGLADSPVGAAPMLGGCHMKQVKVGEMPSMGKDLAMYVYRSIQTEGRFNALAGPKISIVSERGNIKSLSDADKSLFDIPAGFTKAP